MKRKHLIIYIIGGVLITTPMLMDELLYFDIQAPLLFVVSKTISMFVGCTMCIVSMLHSAKVFRENKERGK